MLHVELHCHSSLSPCSGQSLDQIINACAKKKISAIAITDHDETSQAFALQKRAPKNLQVIIGEEINTQSGEVIGYFLQEKIAPELTVAETFAAIKKQGGLVSIPHPTDILRKKIIDLQEVLPFMDQVDIIETFNSRNLLWWNNWQAKKLAAQYGKIAAVGSDAHFEQEIGRSLVLMEAWDTPQQFLERLRKATFVNKHSTPYVYWLTILEKREKKMRRQ